MATVPITSKPRRVDALAYAGQTEVDFDFWINSAADIDVYINDTLITDYTLTGIQNDEGGTITLGAALAEDDAIAVVGNAEIDRVTGFSEGGGGDLRGESLNIELTRLVAILQEQREAIDRTIHLALSASFTGSLELPTPSAHKALVWNPTGTGLTNSAYSIDDVVDGNTPFTQNGTGAAERTFLSKLRETAFSVTDFDGANDRAKVVAALAAAYTNGVRNVVAPTNLTLTGNTIDIPNGVNLHVFGDVSVAGMNNGEFAFTAAGSAGTFYALASDAAIGATTLTLSAANLVASGIAANDWIHIKSDTVFDSLRTVSKYGDMLQVKSVDTGTGVITLYGRVPRGYTTAANASLAKVTTATGKVYAYGKIYGDGDTTKNHGAIKYIYAPHAEATGRYELLAYAGVQATACPYVRFFDIKGYRLTDTNFGYLVSFDGPSTGMVIGLRAKLCRHAFSTNNSSAYPGIVGGTSGVTVTGFEIDYSGLNATGGSCDALDTHAAAENIHLMNGVVRNSTGKGFNGECRSGSLKNVTFIRCGTGGATDAVGLVNYTDQESEWDVDITIIDHYGNYPFHVAADGGTAGTKSITGKVRIIGGNATNIAAYFEGTSSNKIKGVNMDVHTINSPASTEHVRILYGEDPRLKVYSKGGTQVAAGCVRARDTIGGNYDIDFIAPSGSTGIGFYANATTSGATKDASVKAKVKGASPSNLRGVVLDNNAQNCRIDPASDIYNTSNLTTPISWGTGTGHTGRTAVGSTTYDAPSLADGAGTTQTVTVTGAALGDFVQFSHGVDLAGMTGTAYVSAANTVSLRLQNESGGVVDLASATLKAWTEKRAA